MKLLFLLLNLLPLTKLFNSSILNQKDEYISDNFDIDYNIDNNDIYLNSEVNSLDKDNYITQKDNYITQQDNYNTQQENYINENSNENKINSVINFDITNYKTLNNGLPILHSSKDNTNIIFLDFDGHNNTGSRGWGTFYAYPYDPLNNDPTPYNPYFSKKEQEYIINIWQRVSEDFAPFNIDITTEEPINMSEKYTISHCLITRNKDIYGKLMPSFSAGGVAFINIFGQKKSINLNPALVYSNKLHTSTNIAEVCSHEIGHQFGLYHDAYYLNGIKTGYYGGDRTGEIDSWAPIMGAGFRNKITQWSKGEYLGATTSQDDIAIIGSKAGYKPDDYGNTVNDATNLNFTIIGNKYYTSLIGLISVNDIDMFKVSLERVSNINIIINPLRTVINNNGGHNLDINFGLYDISTEKPYYLNEKVREPNVNSLLILPDGDYYIGIFGSSHYKEKYSSYGSLGYYNLSILITDNTLTTTSIPTTQPLNVIEGSNNIILTVVSKVNCTTYNLKYDLLITKKTRKPYYVKIKKRFINKKNKSVLRTFASSRVKKVNTTKKLQFKLYNLNVGEYIYLYIIGKGKWSLTYYTDYLNQILTC
jgi:hypothetical protein